MSHYDDLVSVPSPKSRSVIIAALTVSWIQRPSRNIVTRALMGVISNKALQEAPVMSSMLIRFHITLEIERNPFIHRRDFVPRNFQRGSGRGSSVHRVFR